MRKFVGFLFLATVLSNCSSNLIDSSANNKIQVSSPQLTAIGSVEDGLYVFRGIPYAEAPVDDLRWRAPRPFSSNEIVDATRFKNECIQPEDNSSLFNRSFITGDEDCLYLNIYVPKNSSEIEKNKLPVMFWIHGGSNIWGSGSFYDYSRLAERKDVIVVTINLSLIHI